MDSLSCIDEVSGELVCKFPTWLSIWDILRFMNMATQAYKRHCLRSWWASIVCLKNKVFTSIVSYIVYNIECFVLNKDQHIALGMHHVIVVFFFLEYFFSLILFEWLGLMARGMVRSPLSGGKRHGSGLATWLSVESKDNLFKCASWKS